MGFIKREKICKGIGKAKGYGCKKPQLNRIYGLGVQCRCYSKWLLESEEGKKKLQSATIKVSKPRLDFEKAKQDKSDRQKLMSIMNGLKTVCHEYIRLRDVGKPCISCGTHYKPDFDAGHFYKSETCSALRFDENNIHVQCIQCNRFKDGEESKYRIGLINRFGKDFVDEIDKKAVEYNQSNFQWDREFLIEKRKYYQDKIKNLR